MSHQLPATVSDIFNHPSDNLVPRLRAVKIEDQPQDDPQQSFHQPLHSDTHSSVNVKTEPKEEPMDSQQPTEGAVGSRRKFTKEEDDFLASHFARLPRINEIRELTQRFNAAYPAYPPASYLEILHFYGLFIAGYNFGLSFVGSRKPPIKKSEVERILITISAIEEGNRCRME